MLFSYKSIRAPSSKKAASQKYVGLLLLIGFLSHIYITTGKTTKINGSFCSRESDNLIKRRTLTVNRIQYYKAKLVIAK